MVQLYQALNQRKSDAASRVVTVYLIEALKNFLLLVLRNTYTGITYLQDQVLALFIQFDGDALPASVYFTAFESRLFRIRSR